MTRPAVLSSVVLSDQLTASSTLVTVHHVLAGAPLLAYALASDPSPVQASPSETSLAPAIFRLVVNAPRATGAVRVRQIVIVIPVDPAAPPRDAANLAAVPPAQDCASIVASGPDGWTAAPGATPGVYVFMPKSGQPVTLTEQGLAITFSSILVSPLVGTSLLAVREWSCVDGQVPPVATDPPSGVRAIEVAKFPAGFRLDSFQAVPANIDPGADPTCTTVLSWSGSAGASYVIQYDDVTITSPAGQPGQPLPPQGSYTITGLQKDSTTFTLIVKAAGGAVAVQKQATVNVNWAHISKFIVMPPVLGRNAKCHLTWSTNGDRCQIDVGDVPANGTKDLVVADTTSVMLTAWRGQDSDQQSRTITVVPPVIGRFRLLVNGQPVSGPLDSGTLVTLDWDTTYAETVSIDPGFTSLAPSSDPAKPTRVKVTADTTFTLQCTGKGPPLTQSIPVILNRVKINTFVVTPTRANPGAYATLSWSTVCASSAAIDGVGGQPLPSGTLSITVPPSDHTYILRCDGPGGPVTAKATLGVNSPQIVECWGRIDDEKSGYIYWKTAYATRVVITGGPVNGANSPANVPAQGGSSVWVTNYQWPTYVISAYGAGLSPAVAEIVWYGRG